MNALVSIMFSFLILPSIALAHYSEPLEKPSISDETVQAIVKTYFNNTTLETSGETEDRVFSDSTVVSSASVNKDGSITLFIDQAFNAGEWGILFKGELGRLPFTVECTKKKGFNIYSFIDVIHESEARFVSVPGDGFRIFEGVNVRKYSALCDIHPVLISLLEESLSI